jgi:hypothetical protein
MRTSDLKHNIRNCIHSSRFWYRLKHQQLVAYKHTYIHTCVHMYVCLCVCVCARRYICELYIVTYVCMYFFHAYPHVCIIMYIHIFTYILYIHSIFKYQETMTRCMCYLCAYVMSFSRRSSFYVLTQLATLCLNQFHLKDKDVT